MQTEDGSTTATIASNAIIGCKQTDICLQEVDRKPLPKQDSSTQRLYKWSGKLSSPRMIVCLG